MTHRNSDSPVTIPLDNTSGEVAQFGLGISHADTQSTQGKEALPQPPEAGLLTHTGRAGGRFDTTPLSHSGQKPNPSSRIGSQIHRRTTFKARTAPGTPNAVTGKPSQGQGYDAATVAHCESVMRGFYDFHLEAGTGPMVNPFPMSRRLHGGRAHAHHNPMEPFAGQRVGRYRPKVVQRVPRCIPDQRFDELFAQLGSHRDRALVAFWVSTGARASELLGATVADVDPGQQLITVIRKGTRALQQLPASPDAFVWLRLYQAQVQELVPAGRDQPLWWTLRRPWRTLTYDAARLMFNRAPMRLWDRTGRCTTFAIPRPTGWLVTRRCP